MNSVFLIGRLTNAVELRYVPGTDNCYCRFTLAVDKGMSKEKKEEAKVNERPTADFINIIVWGRQAENCNKFLRKGKNVAIQGRLQSGSYTANDGTKRYVTEVLAGRVQFIDYSDVKQDHKPFDRFDDGEFELPYNEAIDEEIPF